MKNVYGNNSLPGFSNLDSCVAMKDLSDVEVAYLVKAGNNMAFNELVLRYSQIIRSKISLFKNIGLDSDDLFQEALLALLGASKSYRENLGTSFKTYMGICIEHRLITLYKAMVSQKRIPVNKLVPVYDGSEFPDQGLVGISNPELYVINCEELEQRKSYIKKSLTELEYSILMLYISGKTYEKIANNLNINCKAVDNALQRVRRKLSKTIL